MGTGLSNKRITLWQIFVATNSRSNHCCRSISSLAYKSWIFHRRRAQHQWEKTGYREIIFPHQEITKSLMMSAKIRYAKMIELCTLTRHLFRIRSQMCGASALLNTIFLWNNCLICSDNKLWRHYQGRWTSSLTNFVLIFSLKPLYWSLCLSPSSKSRGGEKEDHHNTGHWRNSALSIPFQCTSRHL